MKFASGLIPYTDAERERDEEVRRKARNIGVVRRKATPSGQRYDQPGSALSKRLWARIVGENDESED